MVSNKSVSKVSYDVISLNRRAELFKKALRFGHVCLYIFLFSSIATPMCKYSLVFA